MPNCEYCNKPLKKIGIDRSNGKLFEGNYGKDWSTRKYHKKCYKLIKEEQQFRITLENLKSKVCPPAS